MNGKAGPSYAPRLASGLAQALMALVPLIYLARVLAPADIGYLGLTLAGATLVQYLVSLRAEAAVGGDEGAESARAGRDRSVVLGIALVGLATVGLAGLAVGLAWPRFAPVFALAPALAAVRFVGALELAGVTDEKRIARHTALNTTGGLVGLVLTVGLISGLGLGWPGRVLALVLTEGGIALVRAAWLAHMGRPHRPAWDPAGARALIAGAAPALVTAVLGWALYNADRLVALATLTMSEVGSYVIAYRVGLALVVINRSLAFALAPRVHARLDAGGGAALVRLHLAYGGAVFALGAATAIAASVWTGAVFGSGFAPAAPIVAVVALGYGLQGFQRVAGIVRTRLGMAAPDPRHVGLAVALHLAVSLVLVPVLGALGPACGTLTGLATVAILSIAGAYRAQRRAAPSTSGTSGP
ncbi:MAG: hypothetical protein WD673_16115 [Alphaproteobacteria bacterium]